MQKYKKQMLVAMAAGAMSLFSNGADAQVLNGPDEVMTLNQAIEVGVSTNPQYGIVANSRRANDEELRQAEALYYPSVDLNADTGGEYTDDPSTRANVTDDDDDETKLRYEAGVTVTQMLFDGYGAKYENERQENRILSSSSRVREVSELVGLDIVEAYLDVLRTRELVQIARENIANHQKILQQIKDSVQAGRSTTADVRQAEARLSRAYALESDRYEDMQNAHSGFLRDVGQFPPNLVLPDVPYDALSPSVEDEVRIALAQSPTLQVLSADIQVASSEYNGTQSTFYPQIDLQGNARQGHDLGGVDGRDRSATALVVMNWNLYRGGGDTARRREFIHRVAQEKEEYANGARNLENNIRTSWAALHAAKQRQQAYKDQFNANQTVFDSYLDQFDLGQRTLLDVLDAQNELYVSRNNVLNEKYSEWIAVYQLLSLKGGLFPVLGLPYSRESNPEQM